MNAQPSWAGQVFLTVNLPQLIRNCDELLGLTANKTCAKFSHGN